MSRDDRDDRVNAILALGRRTRKPVPRGLWIAAAIVAVICATAAAAILLGDPAPRRDRPGRPAAPASEPSGQFGTGAAIGAAAGLAIGFALGRQRRDHSSRRSP